ncbi:MAG: histidine kinase [Cyclobacteriaceae bacterium]|nr:histidine kinase [Cyclobacteriaceae bacterium]
MNKTKFYWGFQLVGWSFYVIVNIIVATIVVGNENTTLIWYFPLISEAFFFIIATHFFRFFIKRYKWMNLPIAFLSYRVVFVSIIIGVLVYLLRIGISYTLDLYDPRLLSLANLLGNALPNAFVVFSWSLIYIIFQYFDRYNKSLKHQAAFHQMELDNLKSQLNPHFIFNSLNSIRALVDENPKKSKKAITQLSNILRNSLTSDQKKVARFEDEIKMVKDYLSLETIRYEERLQTKVVIHPESYDYTVPPLMIQTLVENGIKHGVAKLKKGGVISIITTLDKGKLKIQIRNTGELISKNENILHSKGLGIANTKKRLKLIYGDKAYFEIKNENANTVLTELILPKEQEI